MIRRLLALALVPLWLPVAILLVAYVAWCDAKDQAQADRDGEGGAT